MLEAVLNIESNQMPSYIQLGFFFLKNIIFQGLRIVNSVYYRKAYMLSWMVENLAFFLRICYDLG